MRNVNEWCDHLEKVFDQLASGSLTPQVATEMNNSAGKVMKAKTGQLAYYQERKGTPKIPFWEEPSAG